ncbi:MAG TPA: hypothetical protein VM870_01880 [Pyrinomonadaceae bacterium]|jgi:hypothetical protein|nr:hypothetical protein [Pyrinomonadaceae bacterium]
MKKLSALFLFVICSPAFAFAQTAGTGPALAASAATASVKQPPELWGFRLGLTIDEVKHNYPTIALGRTDEFGITPGSITTSVNSPYQNNLAGVDHVVLAFVDGRLAHYSASLDGGVFYSNIDEYAARMSRSLDLPHAWRPSDKLRGALMLHEPGFEIFLFTSPRPGIGMTDSVSLGKVLQRWKGNIRSADRIPFSYF